MPPFVPTMLPGAMDRPLGVFLPARGAQLSVNGEAATAKVFMQDRFGRPASSCCLAWSEIDIAKLPPAWAAIPAGRASVKVVSNWLSSLTSPILMVPSVIVPEEWVSLINPKHPEASRITAKLVRLFEYNRVRL